jgi:hypothetical protein
LNPVEGRLQKFNRGIGRLDLLVRRKDTPERFEFSMIFSRSYSGDATLERESLEI